MLAASGAGTGGAEDLGQRVKRAGADVAIDDADGAQREAAKAWRAGLPRVGWAVADICSPWKWRCPQRALNPRQERIWSAVSRATAIRCRFSAGRFCGSYDWHLQVCPAGAGKRLAQ